MNVEVDPEQLVQYENSEYLDCFTRNFVVIDDGTTSGDIRGYSYDRNAPTNVRDSLLGLGYKYSVRAANNITPHEKRILFHFKNVGPVEGHPFAIKHVSTLNCQRGPAYWKRGKSKDEANDSSNLSHEIFDSINNSQTADQDDGNSEIADCRARIADLKKTMMQNSLTGELHFLDDTSVPLELSDKKSQRKSRCTLKNDCPARFYIRELEVYPEYCVPKQGKNRVDRNAKKAILTELEVAVANGSAKSIMCYWINASTEAIHTGHPARTEEALRSLPVHPRIVDHIREVVQHGITTPLMVELSVKYFVKETFPEAADHSSWNRAFKPDMKDIRMHIKDTLSRIRSGRLPDHSLDSEFYQIKIVRHRIFDAMEDIQSLLHDCVDITSMNHILENMTSIRSSLEGSLPLTEETVTLVINNQSTSSTGAMNESPGKMKREKKKMVNLVHPYMVSMGSEFISFRLENDKLNSKY